MPKRVNFSYKIGQAVKMMHNITNEPIRSTQLSRIVLIVSLCFTHPSHAWVKSCLSWIARLAPSQTTAKVIQQHPRGVYRFTSFTQADLLGEVTHSQSIPSYQRGANMAYKVTFESGASAIAKNNIGISSYDSLAMEELAFELSQLFEFYLVPPSLVREVDGMRMSVQLWVDGLKNATTNFSMRDPYEMSKQFLFDYLFGNIDRQLANFLVSKNGKIVSIDHGGLFRSFSWYSRFNSDKAKVLFPDSNFTHDLEAMNRFLFSKEGQELFYRIKNYDQEELRMLIARYVKEDGLVEQFFEHLNHFLARELELKIIWLNRDIEALKSMDRN